VGTNSKCSLRALADDNTKYLGFGKKIADNDHITGPIIATFAITAIFESTRPVRRFDILSGA